MPLSEEFLSGAGTYDTRYFNETGVEEPLREVIAGLRSPVSPRVLDLGSGSGNSIFPLLNLLPDARIIATDMSRPLLEILRDRLAERSLTARCMPVCLDLSQEGLVRENSCDLITGNSILHHLLKPDELLRRVCGWLRPGGHAVFIEPFAPGNLCFGLLCERLAVDPALDLSSAIRDFLRRVSNDIRVRLSHSVPYEWLEDKWIFTETYIRESVTGFADVTITPLRISLAYALKKILSQGLGEPDAVLPAIVDEWSRAHASVADDLCLSARIVIAKPQI